MAGRCVDQKIEHRKDKEDLIAAGLARGGSRMGMAKLFLRVRIK